MTSPTLRRLRRRAGHDATEMQPGASRAVNGAPARRFSSPSRPEGRPYRRFSSNTNTAPAPPCAVGGEWKARTSARCRRTRSTRFFSTGRRSSELRPLPWTMRTQPSPWRTAVAQELAQHRFGSARRQAMQVEFFLCRVFAARQPLEQHRRNLLAPVGQHVAGLQCGDDDVAEFLAGGVLVAPGHLRRRLRLGQGRWRRRGRKFAHLAAIGADRLAEQAGVVTIVAIHGFGRGLAHPIRVAQPEPGIGIRYHGCMQNFSKS